MRNVHLSRREFLQTSACAASGSLAATVIPLQEPLLNRGASPAASDRVRFGIIGVGMEGVNLLSTAIELPGVECVAASDLYDGRHELAKETVKKAIPTTRRYQDLLDNKEIDAIVMAVPDHWHKQIFVGTHSLPLPRARREKTFTVKSRCRTARRMVWQWWRRPGKRTA